MAEIILKGHKVTGGRAEGEALVSKELLSFLGGVDPKTGLVTEKGHELEGVCVEGKILVFPSGKGSSSGAWQLCELAYNKQAPKGIINVKADPVIAVGAIMSNIPMVDRLDQDPLQVIRTGDWVEVDADNGTVRVKPKQSTSK